MSRAPFDPDRIPSRPASPGPARGGAPLTVAQVAELLRQVLAEHVPSALKVVGEVSNFSDRSHWFFSLKDQQATLRCVCFASSARRVGFPLRDGMQVVCTGRLDYYDAQGHLQLYVDRIEPVGQGALELRLRAMIEELRGLGYFEAQRKKPLPLLPRRVAVVTSRSAAALQDVINTAARRWRGCRLMLMDVRVQGAQAAPEIAAAIDAISRHGPAMGIEAIILTRGGGSIEDLWAFNERIVADAVHRCALPIVAAIGHETDTTVAELVADVRASTPTQAAMTLIPDARVLTEQVGQLGDRLSLFTRRHVAHLRQHLESMAGRPMFRRPRLLQQSQRQRLEELHARLQAALPRLTVPSRQRLTAIEGRLGAALPRIAGPARQRLAHLESRLRLAMPNLARPARQEMDRLAPRLQAVLPRLVRAGAERVEALRRQLESVGPMNVLKRGYTYTLDGQGRVIRSAGQVGQGERVTTVLADGRIASRVETVEGPGPASTAAAAVPGVAPGAGADAASSTGGAPRAGRRRSRGEVLPEQGGLFG